MFEFSRKPVFNVKSATRTARVAYFAFLGCWTVGAGLMLLAGYLCYSTSPPDQALRYICLPLEDATDVATLDDRIYVVSSFFARVQVYDLDGHFQFGFQIPDTAGGAMFLAVKDRRLIALPIRTGKKLTLSSDGTLIETECASHKEVEEAQRDEGVCRDKKTGCEFRLRANILPLAVFCRTSDGAWRKVFEENWLYWTLGCVYVWVSGGLISGLVLLARGHGSTRHTA